MERKQSFGAMLITAPSEHVRLYEMSVRVARAEIVALPGYTLFPWLTIRVDTQTDTIQLGAGVTAKRMK